jgi:hypothetical protein
VKKLIGLEDKISVVRSSKQMPKYSLRAWKKKTVGTLVSQAMLPDDVLGSKSAMLSEC